MVKFYYFSYAGYFSGQIILFYVQAGHPFGCLSTLIGCVVYGSFSTVFNVRYTPQVMNR